MLINKYLTWGFYYSKKRLLKNNTIEWGTKFVFYMRSAYISRNYFNPNNKFNLQTAVKALNNLDQL